MQYPGMAFQLLLGFLAACSLGVHTCADDSEDALLKIPRGPAPSTMDRLPRNARFLREKTLFLVANEPVIESHIVSNFLHQLLFTVGIPQSHIRMKDEAMLFGETHDRKHASLAQWLASQGEHVSDEIEYVFLGNAYTRVDPEFLESLLEALLPVAAPSEGKRESFVMGWGMDDEHPTILHHFAESRMLTYPFLDAGTLWTREAFLALVRIYRDSPPPPAIECDEVFELFRHLRNNGGIRLLHSALFCPVTPVKDEYDRSSDPYPPLHKRPKQTKYAKPPSQRHELTEAEVLATQAAEAVGTRLGGCAAFAVSNRHAPVLSHQIFDKLIDFDEELQIKREELYSKYTVEERVEENGQYQRELRALEESRPFIMVEPEDVMIAVKTNSATVGTRLPLLKRLWGSAEALIKAAKRHSGEGAHPFHFATKEEAMHLEESIKRISIRFFSDMPDAAKGVEVVDGPSVSGKAGLCLRLQGIFRAFLKSKPQRRFLIVADDDTLLNVRHFLDMLSLTLQPPIPARAHLANALESNHGFRKHFPAYKTLANEIREYLKVLVGEGFSAHGWKGRSSWHKEEDLKYSSPLYARGAHGPEAVSPLYLGERYAFGLASGGSQGYDFVTMGGGVALDRDAVQRLVNCAAAGRCVCPPNGAADDMLLGTWAKLEGIPLLHARGCHQEKPFDYHPLRVHSHTPLSFHRFDNTEEDTFKMYSDYLDVGEYAPPLKDAAGSFHELEEVDWIDHDWQHTEDHLWLEREGLEDIDGESLNIPEALGSILNSKRSRGIRELSPEELEESEGEESFPLHDEL